MESVVPAVLAAALGLVVVVAAVVIASHLVRVPPDRIAVISGRVHRRGGRDVGYRVVTRGAVVRLPLLEQVTWMPAGPLPLAAAVDAAFTRDGARVGVALRGAVAIAPAPPELDHAVERFLGRPPEEIVRVARETIEGAARGVIAQRAGAEVEGDRAALAAAIAEAAAPDLRKLGLVLDGLGALDPAAADGGLLAAALREVGLLDARVITEVACDVAAGRAPGAARVDAAGAAAVEGALPALPAELLVAAGPGELVCRDGRAAYRWPTAPVGAAQLVAAARLLVLVRDAGGAYR